MRYQILEALAWSFLNGEPSAQAIVERASQLLGRPWQWLYSLAGRYLAFADSNRPPRHRDVVRFLAHDAGLRKAWNKHAGKIAVANWIQPPPSMQPVPAAHGWGVPRIETAGDLADWLALTPTELDWYADLKALTYKSSRAKLRHYHRVLSKRFGAIRLIEAPKDNLKAIQQRILANILNRIPGHPAAHGFVKGRSIKTFAEPHAGKAVVLRMDLRDFFPSFPRTRIQAFFRTMGYPESVADRLGGVCTNATPRDIWEPHIGTEIRAFYSRPHLPQGAPTSPALANACMYRADCRLTGYARAAGAAYTRYADDLAFSGDESFANSASRFAVHVAAILAEEGLPVNHRKTRIMRQGVRQYLAGVVANRRVNVIRADYDRLKAILTNCVRFGPQSQNRDSHPNFRAHILGRISFIEMINPEKGRRLRMIFDRIDWR